VDVQETYAQCRQRVTKHSNTAPSSSESSKEGAKDAKRHMTRKVAEKHPTPEGPSRKKTSTGPLGTGGHLNIDDEKSSQK
jgi:hypothetical protein